MPAPDLPPTRYSLWRWWVYEAAYQFTWYWMTICFGLRTTHKGPRLPDIEGPVLVVCNHASFLDPQIVGTHVGQRRRVYLMARDTLWRVPIIGPLIKWLNAIPVARTQDGGRGQKATMQHCVAILQAGNALGVFPEGTRSPDGTTQPFSPGIMLLIRRAKPTVVPCAIEGTFDAWPRHRSKPKAFGRIAVCVGKPIPADELIALKAEAVERLRDRVEAMRLEMQAHQRGA